MKFVNNGIKVDFSQDELDAIRKCQQTLSALMDAMVDGTAICGYSGRTVCTCEGLLEELLRDTSTERGVIIK